MAKEPPFNLTSTDELFVPAGHLPGNNAVALYWASGVFTTEQAIALRQLASTLSYHGQNMMNMTCKYSLTSLRLN